MKGLSSFFLTILTVHLYGFGQSVSFQETYGRPSSDQGRVFITKDSGYIAVGYFDSYMAPPLFNSVIKFDKYGDTIWSKSFAASDPNLHLQLNLNMAELSGGGYFISGMIIDGPNSGAMGILLDANGDTIMTKPCPGPGCFSQTTDGGFVFFAGNGITKTDGSFNFTWANHYGGINDYLISSGTQTSDHGFIMLGTTKDFACGGPSDYDLLLTKTDSSGNLQWSKAFGTSSIEESGNVSQTSDGGFILTGSTRWPGGAGDGDIIIIKTDANGNIVWCKSYGGSSWDYGSFIFPTLGSPGYVVGGQTNGMHSPFPSFRSYLMKIDLNGNFLWTNQYGSTDANQSGDDVLYTGQLVYDGGFLLSGSTSNLSIGNTDIWLVKTDNNGISGCNELATSPLVFTPPITVTNVTTFSPFNINYFRHAVSLPVYSSAFNILCSSNVPLADPEISGSPELYPFPDPSDGLINFRWREKTNAEIRIFNQVGQLLFDRKDLFSNEFTLDGTSLSPGLYYYEVNNETGRRIQYGKFMICH